MGFKQQLEVIESIMARRPARAVVEDVAPVSEDINLNEDWGDQWTPATMAWYLGGVMEELIKAGKPRADVEAVMQMVIERAMDPIDPEDIDVNQDADTQDKPSTAQIPRGFKGSASGLAPTYDETQRLIGQQLMKMAPKSVGQLPIEDIMELWKTAVAKLINSGKAITIETRKGGEQVIGPNYGAAWAITKNMLKNMGIEITASKDKTIVQDSNDLLKKMATTMGQMAHGKEVSGKEATAAATMMKGAKQRKARQA